MNHVLCTIRRKTEHSFLQSAQTRGQENSSYKVSEQIQRELMICSIQEHQKKKTKKTMPSGVKKNSSQELAAK